MKHLLQCAVFLAMAAGCDPVRPPMSPGQEVPADSATVCKRHCATIGLRLSSVVLAFSSVGCVCTAAPTATPKAPPPAAPPAVSTADDGAAAAMAMADAAAAAATRKPILPPQPPAPPQR